MPKFIPYGRQNIDEEDIAAVVKALRSPLITQGPAVDEFEARVAGFCGAKYAVAFNSGTSALHAANYASDIGSGDEVITSPLTFVASANAAVYMGASPVLVDIDPDTYCIDINRIESAITDKTRAIIPVDYAGYPVDMANIKAMAKRHNIIVIEDAAHALGARRGDWGVGQEADMTMFSFHPVKHITTGEGGVIVCNDNNLYRKLRLFRNHGIEREEALWERNDGPWYYEMQDLGYNYRITDIQCALGSSQLRKLPAFLRERQYIAAIYDEALADREWITVPPRPTADNQHAYHLYPILLDPAINRKEFFIYLRANDIGVQVHYIPIHLQPFYQRNFGFRRGDFPVAEDFYRREISLPIFPGLSEAEQTYVVETIRSYK